MATSRRMTESRSHTGRHRYGIMSRRPDLSTTMADSGTRRHDGLDAAMRKLDIRDSGPRRVEGSPRLHREGTGRSHRGSTASTTLSGVPPRLSAMLAASTESSRRCAVPPTSPPAVVPRRRDSTKSLAAPLGLPSVSSRFANVTSSHHRGDSSSSIRRRSTDDERGDSAYGSRGGDGRSRQRLAVASARATPRRADRARAGGDLGVPARVLRGDRREEGAEQGGLRER